MDITKSTVHSPFLEHVKQNIEPNSHKTFATWYNDNGKVADEYTYQKLWNDAGYIANALRNRWGVKKGDLVVLCYDFGIHFFAAFLGCLRAGVTAVIVYPPGPPLVKSLAKMNQVIEDCSPALILTDSKVNLLWKTDSHNPLSKSRNLWPSSNIKHKVSNIKSLEKNQFDEPNIDPQDLAFLQYTSGSTGNPKGVMVTHSALYANVVLLGDTFRASNKNASESNTGFSWLPQYHDLGLIEGMIAPFSNGWRMHMMSPITFIRNPLLWMQLMSEHRVQWSVAPDFAYRLVAQKFIEAKKSKPSVPPIPNLDLTSIYGLQSGAEPIRLDTKRLFWSAFGDYNLTTNWFMSSYGLAESCVGVCSLHRYCTDFENSNVDASTQSQHNRFVAVGDRETMHSSVTVKIIDPESCLELDDGQSGEIWVAGPSITAGYYKKPELTQQTFHAKIRTSDDDTNDSTISFLKTGDKGFFKDNKLYICGRYKDLIIMNGVNYYPQDIESVAQATNPMAIRPGCCAAFSSNESGNDGSLVLVFELRSSKYQEAMEVCLQVQSAVSNQVGLLPTVVAIKERTICKTTSGKIQRRRNRTYWHDKKLKIVCQIDSIASAIPQGEQTFDQEQSSAPNITDKQLTLDEFVKSLFGQKAVNGDYMTWTDLEITSIQSVELSNFISKQHGTQLPPNFTDLYPTIADLKDHIASSQGKPIDVSLPNIICDVETNKISWLNLALLQLVGIMLLLVLITAPMIPAIYFVKAVHWYFIPFVYPVWTFGYTICTLLAKWIVIGKYTEKEIVVPSVAFVRWWFVDRVIFIWNSWVGHFIQGSKIHWCIYTLLGAKIHPSAKIDTAMQEFDLIDIGKNVSISSHVRCSKFTYHIQDESTHVLHFRPIALQDKCTVDGYLSPGVLVGEGAVVETYAMVADGGQVPEHTIVRGNPAHQFGSTASTKLAAKEPSKWLLDILKIISYVAFLYISFGCLVLGTLIVRGLLVANWEWRYAPLLLTFASILVGIIISVFLNIILKWVLIGKRRPGPYRETLFADFTEWFVDYHFKISSCFLGDLASNSRSWNLIMKLYGMDVDWVSNIVIYNFPPSKVDLISMKNSFSSAALFKIKKDRQYFQTKLIESSIGWNAYVAPGVEVSKGIVAPLASVTQNVIRHIDDSHDRAVVSNLRLACDWLQTDLAYLSLYGIIAMASIPVYELCLLYFHDLSLGLIIPTVSLLMVIQSVMMLLVLNVFQWITYGTIKRTEPWNYPLHVASVTANWSMQRYNISVLTWGTPWFNLIAKFLGSTFTGNGRILFWGIGYDFPYFVFENDAILDYGTLSGHHAVHHKMTLGSINVSGIVHPMTYVMANCSLTNKESGPWIALAPAAYQKVSLVDDNEEENDNDDMSDVLSYEDMESQLMESSLHFTPE